MLQHSKKHLDSLHRNSTIMASLFSYLVIGDSFPKQTESVKSSVPTYQILNTRLTVVFHSSLHTLLWHTYLTSSGHSAAYGSYKHFDNRLSPWSAPQWDVIMSKHAKLPDKDLQVLLDNLHDAKQFWATADTESDGFKDLLESVTNFYGTVPSIYWCWDTEWSAWWCL